MKPRGYRFISSWYANRHVICNGGKLVLCGHAVCDVAETAEIRLREDLVLGANLRRGSHSETYFKIQENGRLITNGRFQVFFNASLEIFPNGELTLGRGYLNTGAAIACAKSIILGDGVFIARNVYITDSDHHQIFDTQGSVKNLPQPVRIGNHVLIGFGAVILKGVTIGDGAVIAAGAVVTQDVPSRCLAAGVPARVVREDITWK